MDGMAALLVAGAGLLWLLMASIMFLFCIL